MPFPVKRHQCSFIRQLANVTILITACNELYFADSLLLGTLCGRAGLKVRNFQTCTEPIRLLNISCFPSIVKDELAVLQQRAAATKNR